MAILSVKAKNAISKAFEMNFQKNLEFNLKNIIVNGEKRGCSGFVCNPENGATVYINTEKPAYGGVKPLMYRYAKDCADYRGYRNRWAETLEELAAGVSEMLKTPVSETKEPRM